MRVLLDYRAALRERSGVGEYTHQLVRSLLAARCTPRGAALDLTIFSSSAKDRLIDDPALQGARTVDRHIPVRLLNLAWHRLGWPPVETLAPGPFDVTHSLHPLLLPTRHAARVVTIHDLNFLHHPERTRAEIRRDYPALARIHAHRADQVIVVSQFTAGEVSRVLGVPDDRISICPPGRPAWQPRTSLPDGGGYVLFFGTLEPRKNVGALLDAYERLAARRSNLPELVLAGKATEQSGPWLERIARAPLDRWVRHIGYVPPDHRYDLYAGARMLVQPSFEEGFGLPVLEAMTVGVPVIGANAGAIPEVGGGAVQLFAPGDPDMLAKAIERLLDDDGLRAACSSRGVARAADFSWSRTAQDTLSAYDKAIVRRTRARGAA
ncbi:MAG TPA: glycosyltransferase family 1 protein [Vicinamibacterales bacterium]|nr:glycosyltransferase family 1 protein [Vicinamibacterales bacterium]